MVTILLVDIDCFFAQAEQVRRPELRGRPVIVGGEVTDRSVVASSSYEARARGIRTAMPIAEAARICPEAVFLRGDFALYAELSRRMHEVCLRHTPLVEMVSLDEAFLDLSGCARHYEDGSTAEGRTGAACHGGLASRSYDAGAESPGWPMVAACRLQRDILEATGLRVSVGAASNRVVAKVASELAKPGGVLYVRPGREAALLAPLAIKELPGVGPRTAERLQRYGLRTVAELAAVSRGLLVESFGAAGEYLHEASRGRGSAEVSSEAGLPKSISRETTFERDTCDRRTITAMLSYLLQRACRQMRSDGLLASRVTLKLRYSDFQTVSRSRTLANPTDHDDELYRVLLDLLPRLYTRRVAVRLVGVGLSNFTSLGRQMGLFDEEAYERRARLYTSMDAVRQRFGFSSLVTSRALDLLETHKRRRDGFQLPVACLAR
jgi:DNA polymerase-4